MADTVESSRDLAPRLPTFTRLEKSDVARLLVESSKLFARSLDAPRIYEVLNHVVCSSVDCDGLLVSSFNSREKLIRCEYAFVDGKPMDAAVLPPLPCNPMPGHGVQSDVIRTGEAKLFADIAQRV